MERDEELFSALLRLAGVTGPLRDSGAVVSTLLRAARTVLAADGASVMMVGRDGRLGVASASGPVERRLALLDLGHGGPAQTAFQDRRDVTLAVAHDPSGYARECERQGVHMVYAVPVGAGEHVAGVYVLTWRSLVTLTRQDQRVVHALAGAAGVGLRNRHELADRDRTVEELQHALQSRVVIEQAKGILAERGAMRPDQAFELMRATARASRRRLADVAQEVVQGMNGEEEDSSREG